MRQRVLIAGLGWLAWAGLVGLGAGGPFHHLNHRLTDSGRDLGLSRLGTGGEPEGNWRRTGGELEVNWRRTGGGLEENWRRTGGELEEKWRRTGGEL